MADKTKNEDVNEEDVVVVEYKVSMHCNACERTVAKTISQCEGVETFTTDMNKHTVVVTGKVDPYKLLKKLKKKTGKKVEILVNEKDDENEEGENQNDGSSVAAGGGNNVATEGQVLSSQPFNARPVPFFGDSQESEVLLFGFSDENPNACSIM